MTDVASPAPTNLVAAGATSNASSEFHKLFPTVPPTESAIHEFQCSLSRRKLLRVGRLYLTPVRLCFYSMLVDPVVIAWSDVENCEKKSLMVFDQIIITPFDKSLFGGELCFTGFMNGAASPFSTIKTLWSVRKKYASKLPATANVAAPPPTATSAEQPQPPTTHEGSTADSLSASPKLGAASSSADVTAAAHAAEEAATLPVERTAASSKSPAEPSKASPVSPPPSPGSLGPIKVTPPLRSDGSATPTSTAAAATLSGSGSEAKAVEERRSPQVRPATAVEGAAPAHLDSESASPIENVSIVGAPPLYAGGAHATTTASQRRASMSGLGEPQHSSGTLSASPIEFTVAAAPATPPRATTPGLATDAPSPVVPQTARPSTQSTPPSPSPTAGQAAAKSQPSPNVAESPGASTQSKSLLRADAAPPVVAAPPPLAPKSASVVAPADGASSSHDTPSSQPPISAAHRRTRSEEASYHAASQSDTLRSFPTVPRTESLLDSFQCSYISGVHRIGKMHITSNYVLFHSVMLTEPIVAKIIDIATVDKSTSMLLFEGLSLSMRDGTRHDFTSFISRDKALQMITQLMATHDKVAKSIGANVIAGARPASPAKSLTTAADASDAQPRSVTPTSGSARAVIERSPVIAPDAAGAAAATNALSPDQPSSSAAGSEGAAAPAATPSANFLTTSTADSTVSSFHAIASLDDFDTLVPTDYGTGLSKPGFFLETPVSDDFKLPVGYTLFDVFHGCFDDRAPVIKEYRESRRETELNWETWRGPTGGPRSGASPPMCGQRSFKCNTMIKVMTVEKLYPFEEYQRYGFCTINGTPTLLFQTSGQASGVTFADTFRAETLYVYTQATDPSTGLPRVTSRMYMYLQFIKFSIIKSKVRSATTAELKENMVKFNDMTRDYLKAAPSRAGLQQALASVGKPKSALAVTPVAAPSTALLPPPALTSADNSATAVAPYRAGGALTTTAAAIDPWKLVLQVVALPSEGMFRAPVLVVHAIGALYLLRAVWALFWWSGPESGAVLAGATADVATLHSTVATVAIAEFIAHVVRPFALAWTMFGLGVAISLASKAM